MSIVSTGSVAVMTIKVPLSVIQCKGNGSHPYYFNVNLNDGTSAFTLNYDDISPYWTSTSIKITDTSGGGCSGTCGDSVAYFDSTTDPSILNVYLDSTYTVYTITATNDTSGNATFIVNNCSSSNGCSTEACLSVTVTDAAGVTDSSGTVPPLQPLTFSSTSGGNFIAQPTALSSFYYGTTPTGYALVTLAGTTTSSVLNTMVVGAGGASPSYPAGYNYQTGGGGGGGVAFSTLNILEPFFLLLEAGEGTSSKGQSSQYTVNTNLLGTNTPALVANGGSAGFYKDYLPYGGASGSPQMNSGGSGTYDASSGSGTTGGGGGSYSDGSGCTPGNGIVWNDCNTYATGGNGFSYTFGGSLQPNQGCTNSLTTPTPSTGNGGDGSVSAGTGVSGASGIIGFQYNPYEVLVTPLTYYGTATSSGTLTFTFTSGITTTTIFYVLVGGGGGGASSSTSVSGGGGGGGAVLGGSLDIQNSTTTATITIGTGGVAGEETAGGDGNTSLLTYNGATVSAQGGIGGTVEGYGGASGNNNQGENPSGTNGGGGGGSDAAATSSTGGTGTTSFFSGIVYGTGGNGGTSGEGSTATSNTGNGGGGGGYSTTSSFYGGAGGSGFVEIYYNANDVSLTFVPSN